MPDGELWEGLSDLHPIVNGAIDNFNKFFIKNSRPHTLRGFVPFPVDLLTRYEGSTQVNSPVHNTADALLPTRACTIKVIKLAAENIGTLQIFSFARNPLSSSVLTVLIGTITIIRIATIGHIAPIMVTPTALGGERACEGAVATREPRG